MNVLYRWIVTAGLVMAIPAWGHCGVCGKGGSGKEGKHKHEGEHARAEVGKPAPDFALKDLDGKEHKLSDLKGKVVVLEWTNQKCPYVRRHQDGKKTMQNTFATFKDKDVTWLAINSCYFCEDEAEDIRKWVEKVDLASPILLDAAGTVGHAYSAKSTPHMFVIDKKGVLRYAGAIDDDPDGSKEKTRNYVEEAVQALLSGSTVAVSSTKAYGCSVKYKK